MHHSRRDLILQLGKEPREKSEAQSLLNKDIKTLTEDGFAETDALSLKVDLHTMFDRKAADTLSWMYWGIL